MQSKWLETFAKATASSIVSSLPCMHSSACMGIFRSRPVGVYEVIRSPTPEMFEMIVLLGGKHPAQSLQMEDTGACLLFHLCEYFGGAISLSCILSGNMSVSKQEKEKSHKIIQAELYGNRDPPPLSLSLFSFSFLVFLWPNLSPLRVHSKLCHLRKNSGNPARPACGNR